jgi:hypothetical protein
MTTHTVNDNRNHGDVETYYTARIDALKARIRELEDQLEFERRIKVEAVDMIDNILCGFDGGQP